MKFLVMFALISLASSNLQDEITRGNIIDALVTCQRENDVTIGFNELFNMKSETNDVKKLRFCMLKNLGLMTDDGKLITNVAKKTLVSLLNNNINEEYAASVIDSCNGLQVSGDQCETASATVKCVEIEVEGIGLSIDFLF